MSGTALVAFLIARRHAVGASADPVTDVLKIVALWGLLFVLLSLSVRRTLGGSKSAQESSSGGGRIAAHVGRCGRRCGPKDRARFLAAGYPVYGEDRNREQAQGLIHDGLQWRNTPRQVAQAADVVFTSVPDDGVLKMVASGPDGIIAGLAAEGIWVDMSTVSPRASRELAERVHEHGAAMLDAPVSGSVPQVQAGTLTRATVPRRMAA